MKYEWRKHDKSIYLPKQKPVIIDVPEMQYITIKGKGNPGGLEFQACVQTLYSLSYPIKISLKKQDINNDYTVFPLEGVWDLDKMGRTLYNEGKPVSELKDYFVFTLMIRQPDFLSKDYFNQVRESVYDKKKNAYLLKANLETIEEGLSCQMLHLGSYDNEPASFKEMEEYCVKNGYTRLSKVHKEIYLSDARKVAPEKLKTTLRFKVRLEKR